MWTRLGGANVIARAVAHTASRMNSNNRSQRDIVAVIGTTGVGKSQLAVDLAQHLRSSTNKGLNDAVVLSSDSMQLYEGLPLITNKVTDVEMGGIEHWGINVVRPGEGGSWEIGKWCQEALCKAESLPDTTLPIICGGTHYYVQHFLFPPSDLSIDRPESSNASGRSKVANSKWTPPCTLEDIESNGLLTDGLDSRSRHLLETFYQPAPSLLPGGESVQNPPQTMKPTHQEPDSQLLEMHRLLQQLDLQESSRWHWKDGRKVRRAVERWWEDRASELLAKRNLGISDDATGAGLGDKESGKARYRTLILWVYDTPDVLNRRLDERIDAMVQKGLVKEIIDLREHAARIYGSESSASPEEGIFQSIGYKEFAAIPTEELSSDHPLFASGLERMKLSTRQYAKKQIKWIRKQLLPAVRKARQMGGQVDIYVLPAGRSEEGIDLIQNFLQRQPMPQPQLVGHPDTGDLLLPLEQSQTISEIGVPGIAERQVINARRDCPVCSLPNVPVSIGVLEWDAHVGSRGHRRAKLKKELPEGDRYMNPGSNRKARRKALLREWATAQTDDKATSDSDDDASLGTAQI